VEPEKTSNVFYLLPFNLLKLAPFHSHGDKRKLLLLWRERCCNGVSYPRYRRQETPRSAALPVFSSDRLTIKAGLARRFRED
jgi:hypothetical protein